MKAKRRMQKVNFTTVEDLFDYLPEDELTILQHLRMLVLDSIPDVSERLSYNVPYYRRHADICFIWPGSIGWGKKTYEGVRFGFTQGYLIPDETGFLDRGQRKQVYWHDFLREKDIDDEVIIAFLLSAVDIDESHWHDKQKAKRRR